MATGHKIYSVSGAVHPLTDTVSSGAIYAVFCVRFDLLIFSSRKCACDSCNLKAANRAPIDRRAAQGRATTVARDTEVELTVHRSERNSDGGASLLADHRIKRGRNRSATSPFA